ncbi:MAG: histidine phosphatase family protein [Clostridiaceae bacterium]|nr:histidine phosphatase family protein [Clostridiaceae bacterium]
MIRKRLYLIRHGLTEWNRCNRFQGASNISLCEEGIEQAKRLSKRMSKFPLDAVYASDLDRALQTAQIIAQPHDLPVNIVPQLREINFGEWEGLTKEEIIKLKKYDYNAWRDMPHKALFPGEGNLEKVRQRVMTGMKSILERHETGNIAVVSHGGCLKIIIMSLLGLDLSFYKHFWLGNTSLSIIDVHEDRKVLSLLNDMSHLE